LNVDTIIAKNDGGLHIVVKNGEWKHWRPGAHVKTLPVVSFEVLLLRFQLIMRQNGRNNKTATKQRPWRSTRRKYFARC
jgi:hypothetical protein